VAHKPSQGPSKGIPTPAEKLKASLAWLMSTKQGRYAAWWLLDEVCGLFSQTFTGEATHQTAFHAGQRQVAIEVMQQLKRAAPHEYVEMLRERLGLGSAD
jgi:hypothetical protein